MGIAGSPLFFFLVGMSAPCRCNRYYPAHQMEYCENTLRHLIDHAELWREEQRCWKLFRQMLEGVDFIHSKGIIHRCFLRTYGSASGRRSRMLFSDSRTSFCRLLSKLRIEAMLWNWRKMALENG